MHRKCNGLIYTLVRHCGRDFRTKNDSTRHAWKNCWEHCCLHSRHLDLKAFDSSIISHSSSSLTLKCCIFLCKTLRLGKWLHMYKHYTARWSTWVVTPAQIRWLLSTQLMPIDSMTMPATGVKSNHMLITDQKRKDQEKNRRLAGR